MTWNAFQAVTNALRGVVALLLFAALLRSGRRQYGGWWRLFRLWPLRAQLSVGFFVLSWALPMIYSSVVLATDDVADLAGPVPVLLATIALLGVAQLWWRVYRGTLLDPPP